MRGGHSAAGTGVTCTLVAQGKTFELGDCTGPVTHEVMMAAPGVVTVELTVKDPTFAIATASVRIEASPRPNAAPSIDALAGLPAQGVPPYSSALSFTVTLVPSAVHYGAARAGALTEASTPVLAHLADQYPACPDA